MAKKRTKVTDPEGNVIKTKTNTRTGKTVTKVKYADPKSSSARRERTVSRGPSSMDRAVRAKYSDEMNDLGYKKGGVINGKSLRRPKNYK